MRFQNMSNSFYCGRQRETKHVSDLFYEKCFRMALCIHNDIQLRFTHYKFWLIAKNIVI